MHEGHRARLKKRFESEGLASFSEVQALELLLFYALPRVDTNPLAHNLLDRFGSLSGLFEAETQDIAAVRGIGKNTALLIKLLPEMTRKFWIDQEKSRRHIQSAGQAADYIRPILFGKPVEHAYVFCLDNQFGVIHYDCISQGTVDDVTIYVRRIAECAMRLSAGKVLLAHNHPGGDPRPSDADIKATRALALALSPLGIDLVDHLIFSGHSYYSFSAGNLADKKYSSKAGTTLHPANESFANSLI